MRPREEIDQAIEAAWQRVYPNGMSKQLRYQKRTPFRIGFIAGAYWQQQRTAAADPSAAAEPAEPPEGSRPARRPLPGSEAVRDAWRALVSHE